MNNKNLTLNILDFTEELVFFKYYYKNLLAYCIEYKFNYDGHIAVDIIKFIEDLDKLLAKPDEKLNNEEIKFLIKIAEGRVFLELNKLSFDYNRQNTHEILKVPRYKMYHRLETHGY
ncbi:MAG: hypothetical protein IJJ47_02420 [Methanosphaera sp.]|nr:hypothetical protein [Methanosphaera sp.]